MQCKIVYTGIDIISLERTEDLHQSRLKEKQKEAVQAVLPIVCIVLLLSFTIAPLPTDVLLSFLLGAVMLVIGMMLFNLGADLAMAPMGEQMGAQITRSKKLSIILPIGFLLGFLITISEPDLQVLANQVKSIPNLVLIFAVAGGVGLFLAVALCRMLFSIPLRNLLVGFYLVVFILSYFVPRDFLAIAFDSGGVTTGPMTVPFIMAMGVGISAIRSDKHASNDSFGLVALCSIGPILAVLILGLIFRPDAADYAPAAIAPLENSILLGRSYLLALPTYLKEIAIALLPIIAFFLVFQLVSLRLDKRSLLKIFIGLFYTFTGLVLFLTGANVGFMPAGSYLGQTLASLPYPGLIIPIGMVIGYFIVMAEPAVYVLMKQVEEITDGAITGQSLKLSLSIGVSASVGLAMVRVLTGISIYSFIIPGYAFALILSLFVPKIFTAIAFDSGGVASGPMTATFLLPLAIGASSACGGNIITDAFGVVTMVAMTPLITIQILGLVYRYKERQKPCVSTVPPEGCLVCYGDYDIIEL